MNILLHLSTTARTFAARTPCRSRRARLSERPPQQIVISGKWLRKPRCAPLGTFARAAGCARKREGDRTRRQTHRAACCASGARACGGARRLHSMSAMPARRVCDKRGAFESRFPTPRLLGRAAGAHKRRGLKKAGARPAFFCIRLQHESRVRGYLYLRFLAASDFFLRFTLGFS